MRKMAFKRVRPITKNDVFEIELNWFQVRPGREFFLTKTKHPKHEFYSEFFQWITDNCEGRWYIAPYYSGWVTQFQPVYFQNDSDRIKFILRFL